MVTKLTLELDPQGVTDLMRLISIAVWVRSEQLADLDHQRLLGPNDVKKIISHPVVPAIILDPRLLIIDKARADMMAGQDWWTKLERMSAHMPRPDSPSWYREDR